MWSDDDDALMSPSVSGQPVASGDQAHRHAMASRIQRHWRGYADAKRTVGRQARDLVAHMGRPVWSFEEFMVLALQSRELLVSIHTEPSDPFSGHARFIWLRRFYELQFCSAEDLVARSAAGQRMHQSRHEYRYVDKQTQLATQVYAVITVAPPSSKVDVRERMSGPIARGELYVLHPAYPAHFFPAFRAEREHFMRQPYGYGLGYTCVTFVLGVLQRMARASGRPSGLLA